MSHHIFCRLLAGLLAATLSFHESAAAATTGTISGRVQNSATRQFLNNARVALSGTDRIAFTDRFGSYHLVDVPAGPATLEVFYTGLDLARVPVVVPPGGIVTCHVELTSVARYGVDPATVRLDAFIVASDRETDAQAIATNEQRFAPNIKNVMATDSLGDVLGGSVGEFMKFIPGVTTEYDNLDIASISVRGIGGSMTAITTDGAPTSSIWTNTTRTVDLRSMGLNDLARIELSKVPTPAYPADSLAGSINLVGKSAFERSGRQFRFGLNLVGNDENLTLRKTPHTHLDRNTYKVLPGANFDFTWPVSKTFGVVIAGMSTQVYNEQHYSRNTWSNTGTGINGADASLANPFVQSYFLADGPRNLTRNTLSVKTDWQVARSAVLSFSHAVNRAQTRIGTMQMTITTGTNGTPSLPAGVPLTWDSTFTRGATGRGSITNNGASHLIEQGTDTTNLTYRHDDGHWRLEAGLSRSASLVNRRYADAGFFLQASAINKQPVRINFLGISKDQPALIEAFDDNNQPVEWRDIANFRGNTANNQEVYNRGQTNSGYVNLRRSLDLLPFPTRLQVGASQRLQFLDTSPKNTNWTFMGPDGASGATAPLQPYVYQVYRNMDSFYGFRDIQGMSAFRAWQAFRQNPLLYAKSAAQQFAEENFRLINSEYVEETVRAAYTQAEATLCGGRLRILGGVRFEQTINEGQGVLTQADAVWLRDAGGAYVRTPAGARIRRPEAGAINSLEQLKLTSRERGALASRTYSGSYPSLHLTAAATENLLVRVAFASTYGRPDFTDIIPRTVATAADLDDSAPTPVSGRGTLSIRNPTLKPWTARNYDLSVEYYTPQGGVLSAGLFRKDITNFFGDSARIADAALLNSLGLDQQYLNWNVTTKFNAGDARINGAEFNARQSLRGLGKWGRQLTVFGNGTFLDLDGKPGASFTSFIPKSGNWGATLAGQRFTLTARWNYRGQDRRLPQAAFGPDGYEYFQARTTLDFNAAYQLTRVFALTGGANNVTNTPQTLLRYGSATPAYARQYQTTEYGVQIALGLRGTF